MSLHSATEQLEKLKAEYETAVQKLKTDALAELKSKREAMAAELRSIDAQIAELTGKRPGSGKPRKTAAPKSSNGIKATGAKPDLQELKALLSKADGKTLNIRKEGLDTANIKTLAASNPGLLKMGGKNPWPTVALLK